MIMRYAELIRHPGVFQKMTGLRVKEFDQLWLDIQAEFALAEEKRLEKAARLLKAGTLRVSQIARRCGFDSENYFRQQFRERFGMSPRQFRASGRLRSMRRPAPVAATA